MNSLRLIRDYMSLRPRGCFSDHRQGRCTVQHIWKNPFIIAKYLGLSDPGALKEAKSNNKTAFLKRNKLIVEGASYTVADIENAKKLVREESYSSPVTERKVVSEPPTPSPRGYETEENFPEIESETEAEKKIEKNKIEVESEKRLLRKEFIIAETKNTKEELKRSFEKGATAQSSTTKTPKTSVAQGKSLRIPKNLNKVNHQQNQLILSIQLPNLAKD
ncbi:hypothetical protein JTB14_007282 [Gonioctena quinquepunctata]|nr:hypothetical protein JTB14_007282 [Gonioctena quinquepunctata]